MTSSIPSWLPVLEQLAEDKNRKHTLYLDKDKVCEGFNHFSYDRRQKAAVDKIIELYEKDPSQITADVRAKLEALRPKLEKRQYNTSMEKLFQIILKQEAPVTVAPSNVKPESVEHAAAAAPEVDPAGGFVYNPYMHRYENQSGESICLRPPYYVRRDRWGRFECIDLNYAPETIQAIIKHLRTLPSPTQGFSNPDYDNKMLRISVKVIEEEIKKESEVEIEETIREEIDLNEKTYKKTVDIFRKPLLRVPGMQYECTCITKREALPLALAPEEIQEIAQYMTEHPHPAGRFSYDSFKHFYVRQNRDGSLEEINIPQGIYHITNKRGSFEIKRLSEAPQDVQEAAAYLRSHPMRDFR